MVRVILDTNALLQTFPRKSPKHWIFQYFLEKKYELIVTTDILLEYHEIIARKTNASIAENPSEFTTRWAPRGGPHTVAHTKFTS